MSLASPDVTDHPGEARFKKFQEMLIEVLKDPDESARFNAEVTDPASLIAFCAGKGVQVRQTEAQGIFDVAETAVKEQLEAIRASGKKLDDSELENLAGGVSVWVAGGIALGAIAGVALAGLALPALAAATAGAMALEGTAIIGSVIASAGASGLSGAVVGGLVGGGVETVKNLFQD
jgi:hypothetical protein